MSLAPEIEALRQRQAPLDMAPDQFREIGHRLVDEIANRLAALANGPVTRDESPAAIRETLAAEQPLPASGTDAGAPAQRGDRHCCSTIPCSTGIRAFSATSPRARRRSACSAISWRPRSIRTWAADSCRRSRLKSKRRPSAGSPS